MTMETLPSGQTIIRDPNDPTVTHSPARYQQLYGSGGGAAPATSGGGGGGGGASPTAMQLPYGYQYDMLEREQAFAAEQQRINNNFNQQEKALDRALSNQLASQNASLQKQLQRGEIDAQKYMQGRELAQRESEFARDLAHRQLVADRDNQIQQARVEIDKGHLDVAKGQLDVNRAGEVRQERELQARLAANPEDTVAYEFYKRGLGSPQAWDTAQMFASGAKQAPAAMTAEGNLEGDVIMNNGQGNLEGDQVFGGDRLNTIQPVGTPQPVAATWQGKGPGMFLLQGPGGTENDPRYTSNVNGWKSIASGGANVGDLAGFKDHHDPRGQGGEGLQFQVQQNASTGEILILYEDGTEIPVPAMVPTAEIGPWARGLYINQFNAGKTAQQTGNAFYIGVSTPPRSAAPVRTAPAPTGPAPTGDIRQASSPQPDTTGSSYPAAPPAYDNATMQRLAASLFGSNNPMVAGDAQPSGSNVQTLYNPNLKGTGVFDTQIQAPNSISRAQGMSLSDRELGVLSNFLKGGVDTGGGKRVALDPSEYFQQTEKSWIPTYQSMAGSGMTQYR